MAGRPIEIIVTSDTSGVEDGSRRIADSLENVQDALTDVESAAQDTGDSLGESLGSGAQDAARDAESALEGVEDSLRNVSDRAEDVGENLGDGLGDGVQDGARDVSRALEGVEDSLTEVSDAGRELDRDLTQALDSIDSSSRTAGRGIGDNVRDGTDRAREGLGEFRDEANSTARESAASFDGSADSIVDAFQEVAANAFAGFGPAGAIAGLAIASTIGIAITKLQDQAEDNNAAKESIGELAQAFMDAGGALTDADLANRIKEFMNELVQEDVWYKFGDQAKNGLDLVKEGLEGVKSVSEDDVFAGLAGDSEAADRALQAVTEALDNGNLALEDMTFSSSQAGFAVQDNVSKQEALRDALIEAKGTSEEAAAAADSYARSEAGRAEAVERTNEAQRVLAEANMGLAETQIALAEGTAGLTATLSENGATVDINTAAGRNNASAIIDQAAKINELAQAEVNAGGTVQGATANMYSQRDALVNAVTPAFGGSRQAAEDYINKLLYVPKTVNTDVNLDGIPDAQQQLNSFTSQRPGMVIDVRADTSSAQYAITQLNGQRIQIHADAIPRIGQPIAN